MIETHGGHNARFCPNEPGICGPVFAIGVDTESEFVEVLLCAEDLYDMSYQIIKATGRDPGNQLENPDSPISCGCGADCCRS